MAGKLSYGIEAVAKTNWNNEQKVKKSTWGLCTVHVLSSIKRRLTLIRFVSPRSRRCCSCFAPCSGSRSYLRRSLGQVIQEHVPKKLLDFFDQDMPQLFDFERVLIDQMILFDRDALYHQLWRSPAPREGCKTTWARRPAWRKPGRKGLFARACRSS